MITKAEIGEPIPLREVKRFQMFTLTEAAAKGLFIPDNTPSVEEMETELFIKGPEEKTIFNYSTGAMTILGLSAQVYPVDLEIEFLK